MIVLIPAYRPGQPLVTLVRELFARRPAWAVLVVDDGSGDGFSAVFDAARRSGAVLVHHRANLGKGAALRTGIAEVLRRWPGEDVVCADADGQHATCDILAVADAATLHGRLVLGVRALDTDVPARSRLGNAVTSLAFRAVTGRRLADTQTGLRAFPADLLRWLLTVPGDRYDYELSVLLRAASAGLPWRTVPVRTIYAAGNSSSHFRPVRDSVRIYLPLAAFALSSAAGFVVDAVALVLLTAATGSLAVSVVAARVLSAGVNYAVNRRVVFAHGPGTPRGRALPRYVLLALGLLAGSYVLVLTLTSLDLPLVAAKLIADLSLFGVSFVVQRRFVYDGGMPAADPDPDSVPPGPAHPAAAPAPTTSRKHPAIEQAVDRSADQDRPLDRPTTHRSSP